MKPHIVILGAGFGGLTLASELDELAAKDKALVTLVDKNARFSMGFSMQWVMMDRRKPEDGERSYANLKLSHVKFVQEEITKINTQNRTVQTGSTTLNYDYLVIALGAELTMEPIHGLSDFAINLCELRSVMKLKEILKSFSSGNLVIMVASTPFKCPPAPYEYALLIDDLLRQRNARNNIGIILTTPEPQPMPVAGKAAGDFMKAMLAEKNVGYLPLHKPKSIIGEKILYENGFELGYDLLCVMPVHRAPKVVRDAKLTDAAGFVPVELTNFLTSTERVYAVGDAASIKLPNGNPHPKAGVFAEVQAHTVAQNIAAEIMNDKKVEYPGSGICYIDTGNEQAVPASINLLTPEGPKATFENPSFHGLKEKQLFESERLRKWFKS